MRTQTARNVVPGRVKALKKKKKTERTGRRKWIEKRVTYKKKQETEWSKGTERTRQSGGKIEKRVRIDAPHIISTMLLEPSSLRLVDHPWTASRSHRLRAARARVMLGTCNRLATSWVDPLSRNLRRVRSKRPGTGRIYVDWNVWPFIWFVYRYYYFILSLNWVSLWITFYPICFNILVICNHCT